MYKLVLVFAACLVFTATTRVSAQGTTITVSPAILEAATVPGTKSEKRLVIQNSGELPLPVSLEAQSLFSGQSVLLTNNEYDAASWLKLSETTVLLAAGEQKEVPFLIETPPNAGGGGHYAQISIRGLSLESSQGTKSLVIPEVTASILITVPGDIREQLLIDNVEFANSARPSQQKSISFELKNVGNTHSLASPSLAIYKDSELISKEPIPPQLILPGENKQFVYDWQAPSTGGKYQLNLEISYGSGQSVSDEANLFVGPSAPTLFLLLLLVWCSLFILDRRKRLAPALRELLSKTN